MFSIQGRGGTPLHHAMAMTVHMHAVFALLHVAVELPKARPSSSLTGQAG